MKKLLNKTIKPFALYSLLVLILSIPAYFLIINTVWQEELDKHHKVVKHKIELELNDLHLGQDELAKTLALWNRISPGTTITPARVLTPDSFYSNKRFDQHYGGNEQFRCLSTGIFIQNVPYHLLIETNMEEVDETILIIAAVTLFFFIFLLAGLIVLSRKLSKKIWRPFYHTIAALKAFDLNSQNKISLEDSNIIEFEELNVAVQKLIAKNAEVFRNQKEFSENASHELQTPLAMLQSKIDLLLQDDSLTKKQSATIESINTSLARISRINKNLLLLSKLENGQFPQREEYDISEGIPDICSFFKETLIAKNIIDKYEIAPSVSIQANKGLFDILFSNLFSNAVRHNDKGGEVITTLSPDGFTIVNTGNSPLDGEKLFKRFITSSAINPSSGLGLAIAKEICRIHGWEISYLYKQGFHSFSVKF